MAMNDKWVLSFYDWQDILYLEEEPSQPHNVRFIDRNAAVLLDWKTYEILGFMIENFKKGFLPRHPDLAARWNQARGCGVFPPSNGCEEFKTELMPVLEDLLAKSRLSHPRKSRSASAHT